MHDHKGSSKERICRKSCTYRRDISATHSRTKNSSSSTVNASWDHFDYGSCCNHVNDQAINRPAERKAQPLNKSRTRSIDDNPCMPTKNMLLENDLELKLLLQQLHDSAEFLGTINPLWHSHYLAPNKDPKLNGGRKLKDMKFSSGGLLEGHTSTVGGAAAKKRNTWLAFNAVLDEHLIQWDWRILLRRRILTAILATTGITMMHYEGMKKSPQKSELANRNIDDDTRRWKKGGQKRDYNLHDSR